MNSNSFPRLFSFLLLNAAAALLFAGCASQSSVHSFNADYGQHLACSPNYSIENVDDNFFKVHVMQGSPSPGLDRVIYMKQAARAVAASEAKRRGWESYDLNYMQDDDRGWMHVLVADVTRKNPVELKSAPPANNP